MLKADTTVLLLVDIQGRLADIMHERDLLYDCLERLVRGVQLLDVPVVWVEQNPARMGPTVARIAGLLPGLTPIPKMSFSACGEPAVLERLAALRRPDVLVAGIESHVCVYQTAVHLLEHGYHPQVVADAVSSRTAANRALGLERAGAAGAVVTGTEMCLFEMMGEATHPAFRNLLKIIK